MSTRQSRVHRKRRRSDDSRRSLEDKVSEAGGPTGFVGLEDPSWNHDDTRAERAGLYGDRSISAYHRVRRFATSQNDTSSTDSPHSYRSSRRPSSTALGNLSTTSRSTSQTRSSAHIVCAVSENLARETCVASLDAGSPILLHVTKQGNGQTYAETLQFLAILQPDEVLLNDGRRNSQLARKILELFETNSEERLPAADGTQRRNRAGRSARRGRTRNDDVQGPCPTSTVVKFISRSCFDQTRGSELLMRVARDKSFDAGVLEEYILVSSAHAVLHYTQHSLGATFSRNSLDLKINSGGNNRMAIDRPTLFQLELLANAQTGKMKNSLIGTIDCTKTTVGSRLLRSNIMAPPTRVDTINTRLDLVDTFLGDEEFFHQVMEHLQSLPDVDKMLANVALVPLKKSKNDITERIARKGISALVCIKSTLSELPALARVLEDQLNALEANNGHVDEDDHQDDSVSALTDQTSLLVGLGTSATASSGVRPQRNQLLRAIILSLRQPALTTVLEAVCDIFSESTSFSRNANVARHNECFALKSDSDGFMSIARKAFLSNVDDIYRKADEYAEIHGIHVTVAYSGSRGYYLSVPADLGTSLPTCFIQPAKSGRSINCTTEEVMSLNIRAQDNVRDLLFMTNERIQGVLDLARTHFDALATLCDAVALLDMCHSFADNVSVNRLPWCRPAVSDEPSVGNIPPSRAPFFIRNGRYGIDTMTSGLTSVDGLGEFIPNDTFVPADNTLTVITGINGSGKSTYLKQIAIIVILAHCGSYVPAEQASIPIRTRLCTRIGTADDQEHNISTFMQEMKETAFICNSATSKSLILIDELGRATSNEDGVAIAWSVSEHLLEKQAMTFFVTHYPQLTKMSEVHPSVQNQHMEAKVSGDDGVGICYTHKISSGPCTVSSDYGVEMSALCGWPQAVYTEAKRIEDKVKETLADGGIQDIQDSGPTMRAYDLLENIADQLGEIFHSDRSLASVGSELDNLIQIALRSSDDQTRAEIGRLLSPETPLPDESSFQSRPSDDSRDALGQEAHVPKSRSRSKASSTDTDDSDEDRSSSGSSLSDSSSSQLSRSSSAFERDGHDSTGSSSFES